MPDNILTEDLPYNLPDSEEPCEIYILTKTTRINRSPATDTSKFVPGFNLKIDFDLFIV